MQIMYNNDDLSWIISSFMCTFHINFINVEEQSRLSDIFRDTKLAHILHWLVKNSYKIF